MALGFQSEPYSSAIFSKHDFLSNANVRNRLRKLFQKLDLQAHLCNARLLPELI
jgi:hypothetical protein